MRQRKDLQNGLRVRNTKQNRKKKKKAGNISGLQTVDKLGAGCYAQYHFSLNFDFILVLSSKYKKWLYSSLVFPESLPVFSDSCMQK